MTAVGGDASTGVGGVVAGDGGVDQREVGVDAHAEVEHPRNDEEEDRQDDGELDERLAAAALALRIMSDDRFFVSLEVGGVGGTHCVPPTCPLRVGSSWPEASRCRLASPERFQP